MERHTNSMIPSSDGEIPRNKHRSDGVWAELASAARVDGFHVETQSHDHSASRWSDGQFTIDLDDPMAARQLQFAGGVLAAEAYGRDPRWKAHVSLQKRRARNGR